MKNKYKFPTINHINDVLPHIEGRKEFIVAEKDGYTVVNYVVQAHETFDWDDSDVLGSSIRRECRGLIFDKNGVIMSRRYHKFFNLNEREETREYDGFFNGDYMTLEKLDGSMISPIVVDDYVRWTTKMGITDVAMQCERHIARSDIDYINFAQTHINSGITPIFEWCSPRNRIVIDYEIDVLVLTGLRYNVTGQYVDYENMKIVADAWGIPVVDYAVDQVDSYENVGDDQTREGWVVRHSSGHCVKIKTPWYVQLHRIVSQIESDRQVAIAIVNAEVDDIMGALSVDESRQQEFMQRVNRINKKIENDVEGILKGFHDVFGKYDRKQFALEVAPLLTPYARSIIFKMYNDGTEYHIMKHYLDMLSRQLTKDSKFEEYKKVMWNE